jgi:hypothetical protein
VSAIKVNASASLLTLATMAKCCGMSATNNPATHPTLGRVGNSIRAIASVAQNHPAPDHQRSQAQSNQIATAAAKAHRLQEVV